MILHHVEPLVTVAGTEIVGDDVPGIGHKRLMANDDRMEGE